jgi:hypothetical protein
MIREHERVVLAQDLRDAALQAGDVGTVIHVHGNGEAFEVEFVALDGETMAIATVTAEQVRAVTPGEIAHARRVGASAA